MLVGLLLWASAAAAVDVSKTSEGYANGFIPHCPGSTKAVILTKKSLQKLSFLVLKSNDTSDFERYDYYQMDQLVGDPGVDFKKRTMIFVGGYLSSPFLPFSSSMGYTYKQLGYNVIMLDTFAFTFDEYPRAARAMRAVGKHTAEMLAQLTKKGLNPKKLEILGMSLGGQTISFIAKHYKAITGIGIGTMVALEPAGPCFRNLGPEDRLDKSDADFIIHVATNIDGYGLATPVGHANFYVNGGENQPGDLLWFACSELCSHLRSFDVWQSALRHPYDFIAVQCESVAKARNKDCFDAPLVTNVLGPKANRSIEGIFYVPTTNRAPYYVGKKGLDKKHDFFLSMLSSYNEKDVLII